MNDPVAKQNFLVGNSPVAGSQVNVKASRTYTCNSFRGSFEHGLKVLSITFVLREKLEELRAKVTYDRSRITASVIVALKQLNERCF